MPRLLEEMPVEARLVVPLAPLPELSSHEEELLPRLRVHVAEEQPQVGTLLPFVAGHLGEQRPFSIDDLVVRQRQDEVLGERVDHAKGQLAVVIFPVNRLVRHVGERVVHPAHVPLHPEAEPAQVRGPRDHRPRGRFLGDSLHRRAPLVDARVQPAQEVDGLEVLATSMDVGDPFACRARIVEVEHRRHGVHAEPVGMVPLEPEQRAAREEAAHLVPAVVEDEAAPVRVEALPRIAVLVEVCAVEEADPVLVGREVRRDPVEDHADPVLVEVVDEIHEILRSSVAARRREVPRGLVAPGAVERMLHDRQQLDVREAGRRHVLGQERRDLAVAERAVARLRQPPPRAEVHLVDRERCLERVPLAPHRHPGRVAPLVLERPHDRRGARRHFAVEPDRVRLLHLVPVKAGGEVVLVARAPADAGHESLPDAGRRARVERVARRLPAVEVADDGDRGGIRGPDGEARAGDALEHAGMRPELVGEVQVSALVEQVEVVVG